MTSNQSRYHRRSGSTSAKPTAPRAALLPASGPSSLSRPSSAQISFRSRTHPRRRADSIEESDADDEDDENDSALAGVPDLPDQLPSLPASPSQVQQQDARPGGPSRRQTRAEKLREILALRSLAQTYVEEEIEMEGAASFASGTDELRLAQAIHAYAVAYYQSKGLLPHERDLTPSRSRRGHLSNQTSAHRPPMDRGADVIPPHLWGTAREEQPHVVPPAADVASDPADSDYIASEDEDLLQHSMQHSEEDSVTQRPGPGRRKSKTTGRSLPEPLRSMRGAFDETAMIAISIYVEETVFALLGDHGLSRHSKRDS